jgi:hypothetical protein
MKNSEEAKFRSVRFQHGDGLSPAVRCDHSEPAVLERLFNEFLN